jgi:thiosulfate reductase/polysulfide reductase chain A
MEVEISRRKFLQGTVALTVVGGAAGTGLLSAGHGGEGHAGHMPESVTTKTGTGEAEEVPVLCGMCVNKCAAFARVEEGKITNSPPTPISPNPVTCSAHAVTQGSKPHTIRIV